MLKEVHIIIPHLGSFDRAMQRLVKPSILDEKYPPIPLASAVEMVLCKLLQYHQYTLTAPHGMEDDATWNDVLGMLKVQAPTLEYPLLDRWARSPLDLAYLRQWADVLKVRALLEKALKEAGFSS